MYNASNGMETDNESVTVEVRWSEYSRRLLVQMLGEQAAEGRAAQEGVECQIGRYFETPTLSSDGEGFTLVRRPSSFPQKKIGRLE